MGVWVGNDDNSPLGKVSGGTVPARIWRDFMRQAIGAAPAPRSNPTEQADPGGPVEPLDVPDGADIPMEDGSRLQIREGELIYSTDLNGEPFDIRLNEGGVSVDSERIEEARRRAEEIRREAEERAADVENF